MSVYALAIVHSTPNAMVEAPVHSLQPRGELIAELDSLRATLQEYRVLLDESSDPIFAFYPDGRYRYVNQAFASGVRMAREDIVGRKIWDVFSREEADKRFAVVQWVLAHAESKVFEVRVPRPDGDRFYITTVKPIINSQREVVSVICISKEITERKAMEEQLARMAQFDTLTDLPNRALFNDRLQHAIAQAKRDGNRLALMSIDLDRFKPVNDTHGHHVGDLLLQAVARRMQECVRESDSVGRIGGDEFFILLPLIDHAGDALTVAEKVRDALGQPFVLDDLPPIGISSSIGITLYPDHGADARLLYRHADQAMYRAKAQGRNRVQFFNADESPHNESRDASALP